MSKEVKKYKARIFGELYSIVSDEEDELVLSIVRKVDFLMKEIAAKNNNTLDNKTIAVLAALKATEELIALQEIFRTEQEKSEKIIELLDKEELSF